MANSSCGCGKCSSCKERSKTPPKIEDYLPMDGEGYTGALRQYRQAQGDSKRTNPMWRLKSREIRTRLKSGNWNSKQRRLASYILSTRGR